LNDFVNDSFSDTNDQPFISLINTGLMDMAYERADGNYMVVPYQPFIFTTMYNKTLFQEAGISGTPKNWDEFLDACQQLADIGVTPLTVDNSYIPALFGYTLTRVAGVDKALEIFENAALDDPAVLRTAQVFEDMVEKGFISPRAATNVFPEGQAGELAMETAAIYLNGTWLPNELREINPDLVWGSFPWPQIDPEGAGGEANNLGAQCFAINRNTAYPNAAFAFIRWITLGYWDQKLANDSWGVPMANDAIWPAPLADAKEIFAGTTVRFTWAAGADDNPNISAGIVDGFQRLVAGTFNAQQFYDFLAAIN